VSIKRLQELAGIRLDEADVTNIDSFRQAKKKEQVGVMAKEHAAVITELKHNVALSIDRLTQAGMESHLADQTVANVLAYIAISIDPDVFS